MDNYRTAQLAANSVADYFIVQYPREPQKISISEIRELQDSLHIILYYLQHKRAEIENRLLGDVYQHKVRHGHVGDNYSNNGAWGYHQLPSSQGDGGAVAIDIDGSTACSGEASGMQCG